MLLSCSEQNVCVEPTKGPATAVVLDAQRTVTARTSKYLRERGERERAPVIRGLSAYVFLSKV